MPRPSVRFEELSHFENLARIKRNVYFTAFNSNLISMNAHPTLVPPPSIVIRLFVVLFEFQNNQSFAVLLS